MKLSSKLSALGAVLVLSTAFASAGTITYLASGSGEVGFLGYNATSPTGPFTIPTVGTDNSTGTGTTYGISVSKDILENAIGGIHAKQDRRKRHSIPCHLRKQSRFDRSHPGDAMRVNDGDADDLQLLFVDFCEDARQHFPALR